VPWLRSWRRRPNGRRPTRQRQTATRPVLQHRSRQGRRVSDVQGQTTLRPIVSRFATIERCQAASYSLRRLRRVIARANRLMLTRAGAEG
jgi:hypothetical protein